MRGKTCLITGANAGIGKETAVALAGLGARVLMVCRDGDRGTAARREIERRVPGAATELVIADLSRLSEVRELQARIERLTPRLDVLVSNAGVFRSRRTVTPDGLETTFAVNHLAPFALVTGALDLLERSAPARIVIVASSAHYRGTIDFADLQMERKYSGWMAYAQSKLANVLFAAELARRLAPERVTANSLHPGVVATKLLLRGIVPAWMARPWTITPREGARTSVHAAAAEEMAGVSGLYLDECKPTRPSEEALDPMVASRLWEASERLCKWKTTTE